MGVQTADSALAHGEHGNHRYRCWDLPKPAVHHDVEESDLAPAGHDRLEGRAVRQLVHCVHNGRW